MLTIQNLEIHFDVEGDDDAVFTRMFAEHSRRWTRMQDAERCRLRQLERERSIDDADGGEPR